MKKNKLIKILSSTVFIILALWLGGYIYKWEYRKPLFEVNFLSLNRGRAVFIRSPENKTLLVGGGQNSATIREITKVIPFYSRKIDYVFIPSTLPTQIGGLIEIVDRYEVYKVIKPKIMATSTVLDQLMKEIKKKKIKIEEVERGDNLEIGGLILEVLFPDENFKYNKTSLPELGLKIDYKNTGLFLIGNLSKKIQKDIVKSTEMKTRDNIVEFYNSGIESKVSKDFIEKVNPKYIFNTKEKGQKWVSEGIKWENGI